MNHRVGTALALAVVAVGLIAGCKQTRPMPTYEPLLALEANQARPAAPAAQMYRPGWAGPKPAVKRKGG